MFCSVQLCKRTELQLFRLYYNEVETKRIREELQQREEIIEQENTQRQKIEEEIREKRRELGKLHRDQAGIEQEIKKCVCDGYETFYISDIFEICIFFKSLRIKKFLRGSLSILKSHRCCATLAISTRSRSRFYICLVNYMHRKALENARQQHSSHRQEMDQLEAEYSRILSIKEDYENQQNKKSKEQGRSLELEDSQVSANTTFV